MIFQTGPSGKETLRREFGTPAKTKARQKNYYTVVGRETLPPQKFKPKAEYGDEGGKRSSVGILVALIAFSSIVLFFGSSAKSTVEIATLGTLAVMFAAAVYFAAMAADPGKL